MLLKNNSFNLNFKVSTSDFESLDEVLLMAPRQADGSLPETKFLKLKQRLEPKETKGFRMI